MINLFLASISNFIILVFCHWVFCLVKGGKKYVFHAMLILFLSIVFSSYFLFSQFGFIDSVLIYVSLVILWNSYLIFFINLQNSISFSILLTIYHSAGQKLSYQEIESKYPDLKSLTDRLAAMETNNFILQNGNDVKILPSGKKLALVFTYFRKIFGIRLFG